MSTPPFFLNDLADFLKTELTVSRYSSTEQGGIYYPSKRPVKRLGLALEPFPKLYEWVQETQLDALWLHRPWQLDLASLPPDLGILSHHLPFDETLTMGYNLRLARQLGAIGDITPFGHKQEKTESGKPLPPRPIGMLLDVAPHEFDYWLDAIKAQFGGYDRAEAGHGPGGWQPTSYRIALVGAMTDELIREAAHRGAQLYLTGAYRKPGQKAVDETGIAVVAVGHRRSEEWGLHTLADLLQERWPLECVVHKMPAHTRL